MKYRLGDICTITKGETGIMKAIPGAYTMVALGEANKTHNEFQFDTKSVIIPLVSSTGHGHASMKRVKYQEGKFALGSILCAVIPKNDKVVLAKYLHIYLHWNREELLVSQMKGMANVSLPMNKIADVLVTVPSIEKQQEIIDLEVQLVEKELSVEKLLSDQLNQIENLNQAILQEAVQGKLVKQDKKDEPASELLKRIKAEKLKSGKKEKPLPPIKPEEIPFEIPENWVWCKIGDVSTSIVPNRDKPKTFTGNIPWITQSNFSDFSFHLDYDLNGIGLNEEEVKEYNCRVMPKGSVIMSCVGQFDLVCFIERDIVANQQLHCFVPFGKIEPMYLCYSLKLFSKLMEKEAIHTTIKYINKTKCESILLPLPPLPEQKRIVVEIEKQLAKTKQLKEHIIANQQATEQLLKALLHQAFEVEEMEEV